MAVGIEGIRFFNELEATLENCKFRGIAKLVKSWIPGLRLLMAEVEKVYSDGDASRSSSRLLSLRKCCTEFIDQLEKVPEDVDDSKLFMPINAWYDCHGDEFWNAGFVEVPETLLRPSREVLEAFCLVVDSLGPTGSPKHYYQNLRNFTRSLEVLLTAIDGPKYENAEALDQSLATG